MALFYQMKLPASVGQKKMKAIEQVLEELGIGTVLIVLELFMLVLLNECAKF